MEVCSLCLAEIGWPNDQEQWIIGIGCAIVATIFATVFKLTRKESRWLSFGIMVVGLFVVSGLYTLDRLRDGAHVVNRVPLPVHPEGNSEEETTNGTAGVGGEMTDEQFQGHLNRIRTEGIWVDENDGFKWVPKSIAYRIETKWGTLVNVGDDRWVMNSD